MSFINYASKEINCKIVYYGPALSGKTTNLQYIYAYTDSQAKGRMVTLSSDTERTIFFDFLPLAIGPIRGFNVRFHLYTVPGQAYYDSSRKLILKGVDGVVYVADSELHRMEENLATLENLKINLDHQGYDLKTLPHVIQYNKRDLPNVAPVASLSQNLNPFHVQEFEAIASKGTGVFETLKAVSKLILLSLKEDTVSSSMP